MLSLVVPALVALALAGCSKKESTAEIHASDPPPSHPAAPASTLGTTGTTASASAAAPVGPPPVCKVNATKSWAKGMNKVAGLTAVELTDGRVAVGAASGNTPSVLVVSRGGEGKLLKVTTKPGSDFAKPPAPSEGTRTLLRVTPVTVSNDAATAFVDYHDDYKSKRRRVACGLADEDPFLAFDGVSLLDMDPQPTGDARAALFKKKDADADDGYHEVRDCRSFHDPKTGEKWVVGSDLRGFDKDGSVDWKASLVVDRGAKQHEIHLHDVALKDDKAAKTQKFEVPVSHRRKDGGFVLASRMTNALYVGLLDGD